jgi:hypothetical protein
MALPDRGAAGPSPVLLLTATSADAARELEEKVGPKILEALILKVALARKGETLIVGMDRKRVEMMAALGDRKGGLLGQEKVVAALKDAEGAPLVGVVPPGGVVGELYQLSQRQITLPSKPSRPDDLKPGREDLGSADQARKEAQILRDAMEPLPPAVLSVNRKNDTLVLEMKQASLRTVSVKAINAWVDVTLESALRRTVGRRINDLRPEDFNPKDKPAKDEGRPVTDKKPRE